MMVTNMNRLWRDVDGDGWRLCRSLHACEEENFDESCSLLWKHFLQDNDVHYFMASVPVFCIK